MVARGALADIADECMSRDQESAGYLVGPRSFSWHVPRVERAGAAAYGHRSTAVYLDRDEIERVMRLLDREDSGRVICGSWHSHPAGGTRGPSPADLQTWAVSFTRLERAYGASRSIDLIAWLPDPGRSCCSSLGAWITSRADRRIISSPATIAR
jgi:proteasome lid subunit RPN8/RPN11